MTAEEKILRVDRITERLRADESSGGIVDIDKAFMLEYIKELSRMIPVVQASRSLMIDLGRGNRDVSFPLAEIHNALRALDNKDYLTQKSGIIT